MKVDYIRVSHHDEGQRLDNFLFKRLKGVPKSHVYRIIRSGEVRINKKRAKVNTRVACDDLVRIPPVKTAPVPSYSVSKDVKSLIAERIIFENDGFMVLNKPSGMAVHGGSGVSVGVIEAIRFGQPEGSYFELVHRLDKETSGCLLIAKKRSVLKELHQLLQLNQVDKVYWALLNEAWLGDKRVKVEVALQKNTLKSGERMVRVDESGKSAKTYFTLLTNFKQACLVEAKPITGRTHQIRVHAQHLGQSILGDDKYGDKLANRRAKKRGLTRLFLHAHRLSFLLNDQLFQFSAPLDDDLQAVLNDMKGD